MGALEGMCILCSLIKEKARTREGVQREELQLLKGKMTGQWTHNVVLKIKRDPHINFTQGTALELPPHIYLAGGTVITKCSSEIPKQLYSAVIINRQRNSDEEGETNGARHSERQREWLLCHLHIHLSSWEQTQQHLNTAHNQNKTKKGQRGSQ